MKSVCWSFAKIAAGPCAALLLMNSRTSPCRLHRLSSPRKSVRPAWPKRRRSLPLPTQPPTLPPNLQADLTPSPLVTPKQIIRLDSEPGAVTVAIAQAASEYTDRPGHLSLIGTGPGALDQITPAAKTALTQADAVIGYGLYIDLIRPLLRPGQIVEAMAITQERARAERAIALAHWGLTVAVISSGDSGIYGMAGLVMESLSQAGWDGKTPSVQVFPASPRCKPPLPASARR